MKFNNCKDEKGSVLVMAVVLSFGIILLGLSFLTTVERFEKRINLEITMEKAAINANMGAFEGLALQITKKLSAHYISQEFQWPGYKNNSYKFEIRPLGNSNISYGISHGFMITGIGKSKEYGWEIEDTVQVKYKYESYADYLYISNFEYDSLRRVEINFWSPDTLDGKVHSNDVIHIQGSPVFKELVTSCSTYFEPINNNAIFDVPPQLGAGPIDFPEQADEIRKFSYYHNWGTFAPDSLDSLTELTFSGPTIYRRYCGPDTLHSDSIVCYPPTIAEAPQFAVPPNGAQFIFGKVWVKADRGGADINDPSFMSQGFEGKLTIAASDTIIIVDNLVYKHARPNRSVPAQDSCEDVLGIIGEHYIMMGRRCPRTLYVNAALAAINGSISVQDIYWRWAPGWNNEKQSLQIYGSLAQRYRGIVHTTDYPPDNPPHLRGFIEKDYHYDKRFIENPPPYFLPTKKYALIFMESL